MKILFLKQIDPKTKKEALSINITFEPFQRILSMKPKYYVALYGHAIKYNNEDEVLWVKKKEIQ